MRRVTAPAPKASAKELPKPFVQPPPKEPVRLAPPRPAPPPPNVASSFFEPEPRDFPRRSAAPIGKTRVLEDLELVDRVINADSGDEWGIGYVDAESNLYDAERDAFEDMREKLNDGMHALSDKQRAWVQRAAERLSVPLVTTRSAAELPRGRDVKPAPVLRTLPLAPPGRKAPEPTPVAPHLRVFVGVEQRQDDEHEPEIQRALSAITLRKIVDDALDPDELDARAIYAATPNILEPLALLLGIDEFKLRREYVRAARLDYGRVEVTGRDGEKRRVLRGPDGKINNCAVAAGESPMSCQICSGDCPDLFGREEDDVPI